MVDPSAESERVKLKQHGIKACGISKACRDTPGETCFLWSKLNCLNPNPSVREGTDLSTLDEVPDRSRSCAFGERLGNLIGLPLFAGQGMSRRPNGSSDVLLDRNSGSPKGREPHGDRATIVPKVRPVMGRARERVAGMKKDEGLMYMPGKVVRDARHP